MKDFEQQPSSAQWGPGRAAQGENVTFWSLQNTDGTETDGHTITKLRAAAKEIWSEMTIANGELGSPWQKVPPRRQHEFWLRLEAMFPILRLF